jgi:MFS family permease
MAKLFYSVILPVLGLQFVTWGLYYTFGMYYANMVTDFNSSYSFMGMVGTGASAFIAVFSLINPWLAKTFGYPFCVFFGGILTAVAFFSTSFVTNQYLVLLTYSVIFGMSGSITYMVYGVLFDNITENLDLIMTAISIAINVAYVLFSCFAQYEMSHDHDWRVIFRYYFSVLGLMYACSAYFFVGIPSSYDEYRSIDQQDDPVTTHNNALHSHSHADDAAEAFTRTRSLSMEHLKNAKNLCGFERLVKDRSALILCISNFFYLAVSIVPYKFALIYVTNNGSSSSDALYYLVPIVGGVSKMIGKLSIYKF